MRTNSLHPVARSPFTELLKTTRDFLNAWPDICSARAAVRWTSTWAGSSAVEHALDKREVGRLKSFPGPPSLPTQVTPPQLPHKQSGAHADRSSSPSPALRRSCTIVRACRRARRRGVACYAASAPSHAPAEAPAYVSAHSGNARSRALLRPPPRLLGRPLAHSKELPPQIDRGRCAGAQTALLFAVSREAPFRLLPRSRRRAEVQQQLHLAIKKERKFP